MEYAAQAVILVEDWDKHVWPPTDNSFRKYAIATKWNM